MSDEIEAAAENVQATHDLLESATSGIMNLDRKVHDETKLFLKKMADKIKLNKRNGVSLTDGLDEAWKHHKQAIKFQDEKLRICQKTYDEIDIQVNQFDALLQKYTDTKEEGKTAEYAMGRLAFLRRRKKKKPARRRTHEHKTTEAVSKEDYNVDPSEPRYCYCHRVAFGKMVACDGDSCPYEWFHFECVGLTEDPCEKWYCQDCIAKQLTKQKKSQSATPKVRRNLNNTLSPLRVKPIKRRSIAKETHNAVSPRIKASDVRATPSKKLSLEKVEKSPKKGHQDIPQQKKNWTKTSATPTPSKKSTPKKPGFIWVPKSPVEQKKSPISPRKRKISESPTKPSPKKSTFSPKKLRFSSNDSPRGSRR